MPKVENFEAHEIQVMETTALQSITSAEIDIQIATAHRYPRSLKQFTDRALTMATLDEDTAASCIYRRPVGKNRDGSVKYAEGKSVRLAEIVGASYGNIRVGSIIVEQTDRFVKARGFAHDLETNFACSSEVIESTVDTNGAPYSERMRVVVAKAALAKARRDATFQVIPGAICKGVELAARKCAIGTAQTMEARRANAIDWLSKLGIAKERVLVALGIKGEEDIDVEVLTTITGIRTAIKDGETTVDDSFPPVKKPDVGAPKSKTETAGAAEKKDSSKADYEHLLVTVKASSKSVQAAHTKALDAYLTKASKTMEECTEADYTELIKATVAVLK
jgi:hypothetical protein